MTDISTYTEAELSAAISETADLLGQLLNEAFQYHARSQADSTISALGDLRFQANMLLGFAPEPVNISVTPQASYEWADALSPSEDEAPVEDIAPDFFTSTEAAEVLSLSKQTVMSLVKKGKLKTKQKVRHGHVTLITRASVKRESDRRGLVWPW